ncbi:MAG: hypothetical protein SFU25_00775 [Candidatus Caenarcaniphilales bacterium]|nr:hypothetical protein [Candidatus Caenarcaniphilales bacterium]
MDTTIKGVSPHSRTLHAPKSHSQRKIPYSGGNSQVIQDPSKMHSGSAVHRAAMHSGVGTKTSAEFKTVAESITDVSTKRNNSLHDLGYGTEEGKLGIDVAGFNKELDSHASTIAAYANVTENTHLKEIEVIGKLVAELAKPADQQNTETIKGLQKQFFDIFDTYGKDIKGIKLKQGSTDDADRTGKYLETVLKESIDNIKKFHGQYNSEVGTPPPGTPETPGGNGNTDRKWGLFEWGAIAGIFASLGTAIAALLGLNSQKQQSQASLKALDSLKAQFGQALAAVYQTGQQAQADLSTAVTSTLNALDDVMNKVSRVSPTANAMHASRTKKAMHADPQTDTSGASTAPASGTPSTPAELAQRAQEAEKRAKALQVQQPISATQEGKVPSGSGVLTFPANAENNIVPLSRKPRDNDGSQPDPRFVRTTPGGTKVFYNLGDGARTVATDDRN